MGSAVIRRFLSTPRQLLHLKKCGLRVAYTVLGAADSEDVIFYHHGFPSCRLEALFVADAARAHGLRLITVDRLGFGASPFDTRHSFTHWPHVLLELADQLGVHRFSVMGTSGGPAFAAACALLLPPERIVSLCLVAPEGPKAGWQWRGITPRACAYLAQVISLITLPLWLPARLLVTYALPEAVLRMLSRLAASNSFRPPADRRAMSLGIGPVLGMLAGSLQQGVVGSVHEALLMYVADWGYRLEDIRCPHVLMFHGVRDVDVRLGSARSFLAIPGAQEQLLPEDGHMSILPDRGDLILQAVKAVHVAGAGRTAVQGAGQSAGV